MDAAAIPTKMPTIWALDAGGSYVRVVPVTPPVTTGAASFQQGFPAATFEPSGSGGVPPFGQDMNGILQAVTAWLQWTQAGAPIAYDATFQTDIGGYPAYAIVFSATTAGRIWQSTVDNNATNPDTGGAGWQDISPNRAAGGSLTGNYPNPTVVPGAGLYTGQVFWMSRNAAPSGALICNGAAVERGGANAALFAYAAPFGTPLAPFGVGDGSTTFNVPNLLGQFIRGFDSSGSVDPGRAFGSTQGFATQSHNHANGVSQAGSPGDSGCQLFGDTSMGLAGASSQTVHTDNNLVQRQGYTSDGTVAAGSGTGSPYGTFASETRPTNVALTPCIKL